MGLSSEWEKGPGRIFLVLEALMRGTVDFTIFWRQLAEIPGLLGGDWRGMTAQQLLAPLLPAFYDPSFVDSEARSSPWKQWVLSYLEQLEKEGADPVEIQAKMKQQSPRFIPREWMLVQAYTDAQKRDYQLLHELYRVFQTPYDDLIGYDQYYRITPPEILNRPGTAFMT